MKWPCQAFQADTEYLDYEQNYLAKKSCVLGDATSRQKGIATLTQGLSEHGEAFTITGVVSITAENHVDMTRASTDIFGDISPLHGV